MAEYSVPLILATPHMTGDNVGDAQWLMQGNSRFGPGLAPYKDGEIDKDYGELSAKACERTKFWVGYPLSACNGVFGQTLYEYLRPNKWRPLPDAYRARRAVRIKAAALTPGMKALELARKELGYHESPAYTNLTKFGAEYGFNGVPWCAIFESIMFKHCGFGVTADRPSGYFKYAAVERIYHDAGAGVNHLRVVWTPQKGDVACYRHGNDMFAHTAFFDGWRDQPNGLFYDLGGNTSPDDFANGGEVARQIRSTSQVTRWVRVG